jgi:glutamine synthetase
MSQTNSEPGKFLQDNPDITHLDVLLIDLCGNAIGKRLPASELTEVFDKGAAVCAAMQLVDAMGNTADPMGYGFSDGDPDAFAVPIAGSLCAVPWLSGNKSQVLCEYRSAADGEPLWFEPRQVLKNVLARFETLEVTPCLAMELEFYLLDPERDEAGRPVPARSPRSGAIEASGKVLSLDKLDEFDEVLGAIESACRLQGIPTTSMISEYGAGQFEVNLMHQQDVLRAADHAALLRRAITGVSRSRGFDASFMSKPFADQSGNGMHVHLSLIDSAGRNLFDSTRAEGDLRLGQAIAGLQASMAESMAIFAPNLNVYRRFKPDEFVPVTTDWGVNNRSVAFRIPPSDAANRRLEHRVAGADANPYLVVAAILAGVHHGLTRELDPGAKHSGNAGAEVDASLPLTLWQALDQLTHARILPDYLGSDYLRIYHQVKQAEFEAFMEEILPREYDWYL